MTGADWAAAAAPLVAEYLEDLSTAVNMDSGTYDVALVDALGEVLAGMFARRGCAVEWHDPSDGEVGRTYIATLPGAREGTVVLLGHHDTVFGRGTTSQRPFTVTGTRATGPGVMDMKGGVVLAAYAMQVIRTQRGDDHPTLVFVGNPDEEVGSLTSRPIIEAVARDADLVLVLEPGREAGSILTTRKGVGMYELVVEGRAAHAGARPEDGRSAVLEMAYKTIALHGLTDFARGTTVNVGMVNGGTRRNVVPDRAEAWIDLRVSTSAEGVRAHEAIAEIAATSTVPDTRATLTGGLNRPPMEKTAGTLRALEEGQRLVAEMGLEFTEIGSGGGSDGNFTAAIGVPTLDGLGPVGGNAHSVDEWMDVESLAQRIGLVAGLIDRAPRRSG